ncbi:MAG: Wzz/FepE/Etk N-terminal domain-containing protein [Candidatus Binataceae bacterium]
MADPKLFADKSDDSLRLARELRPASGNLPLARNHPDDEIDLLPYLLALSERWRMIAVATLSATLLSLVVTMIVMPKTYRAISILRPQPKAAMQNRLAGLLGGFGGTIGGAAGLLGGGPGSPEAQEYMTILNSFAFSIAMVDRHGLGKRFFRGGETPLINAFGDSDPRWRAYHRLQRRFSCDYSLKTGNITLYYQARSAAGAERMLGYYVDDLREKLRGRAVREATSAVDSMRAEARITSDSLLQQQLYELIAKQMQQLKLAQVQADFAFTVLEPPIASDKAYKPMVALDAFLAAVLALIVSCLLAIAKASPAQI